MSPYDVVIVGGGLASARAIAAYREAGGKGTIGLVSRDEALPYHRPPLSKGYLRGEQEREKVFVEAEDFYREHEVEVLLETGVVRIGIDEHELETVAGETFGYGKLVLATGASPNELTVPGSRLDGVHVLRTLAHSTKIREDAQEAVGAVTVGAGFIGMEVAASLQQNGLEVTLIHRGDGLFEGLGSPQVSDFLVELYRDRGVNVILSEEVAEFQGDGQLSGIITSQGRQISASLAVVGVGVDPEVSFLERSGIEIDDGIVVNDRFETNVADIYAVGDAARFYDPIFERHRRIEHWSNANYQGGLLGKILAGGDRSYDRVSSFFTEVFGITLKLFGDTSDCDELIHRGSIREGRTTGFYLVHGRLCAALTCGEDQEHEEEVADLIRARAQIKDRGRLSQGDVPLAEAFTLD